MYNFCNFNLWYRKPLKGCNSLKSIMITPSTGRPSPLATSAVGGGHFNLAGPGTIVHSGLVQACGPPTPLAYPASAPVMSAPPKFPLPAPLPPPMVKEIRFEQFLELMFRFTNGLDLVAFLRQRFSWTWK